MDFFEALKRTPIPPFNLSYAQNPYLFIELYILPIAFLFSTSLVTAPFGKFARKGWGFQLPGKITFFLYEAIAGLYMFACLYGAMMDLYNYQLQKNPNIKPTLPVKVLFLGFCYVGHYFYRSVIYTFFISHSMKPQSVIVALCGAAFNVLNAFNNAMGILSIKDMNAPIGYLGAACFFYGLEINIRSDWHLAKLRKLKAQLGDDNNQEVIIDFDDIL